MFRRTDGKIEALQQIPALARLGEQELARLARWGDIVHLPSQTVLTREGEVGREAFLLIDGGATVEAGGQEIAHAEPGDFIGEMALVDRRPRSATVRTTMPTRALVFDQNGFVEMLGTSPGLTRDLLGQMSERLRRAAHPGAWAPTDPSSEEASRPGASIPSHDPC